MKIKNIVALMLALSMALCLCACGGNTEPTEAPT